MQYATEENLTDLALERWEACHSPRLREIMQSLVKHLHSFVHEVDLKEDEWLTAMNWLAKTGQLSSEKRHEFILLSDVLGISMLVDAINHRFPTGATPSTVMGPFHIEGSPELPMGADLAAAPGDQRQLHQRGRRAALQHAITGDRLAALGPSARAAHAEATVFS